MGREDVAGALAWMGCGGPRFPVSTAPSLGFPLSLELQGTSGGNTPLPQVIPDTRAGGPREGTARRPAGNTVRSAENRGEQAGGGGRSRAVLTIYCEKGRRGLLDFPF